MIKMRALQKNIIALFLAVMLTFCAFGADSLSAGLKEAKSSLDCPRAGEFFTGSLPIEEQQTVRELSADWHGIMILRPGRISEGKCGLKDMHVCIGLPEGLRKVTSYKEYSIAGTAQTAQGREAIVSYIHNQDGAKG